MTTYTPREENINGSDLSGSNAAKNRTYTLAYSNPSSTGMSITVQGAALHPTSDFTLSGATLTFVNEIFDADVIRIVYYTTTAASTSNLEYATTLHLANMLGIMGLSPSRDVSSSATLESVGTGDNSTTKFTLDQKNILLNSLTLSYGASAASVTELTETTHYSIDLTTGEITLTAAGVTAVGTNNIYAEYNYVTVNLSDSYLTDVLLRAEQEVDSMLNTTFTDGTVTNPDYSAKVKESQATKGAYDRTYFTDFRPLIDVTSTLNGSLSAGATTLTLATGDTAKFPTTGRIIIDKEIITYSGVSGETLTGLVRGVDDSTAATHADGASVHTTIVEISGTTPGTAPTWYPQAWDSKMYADQDGKIFIYDTVLTDNATATGDLILREPDIDNRFRVSYLYGYDTIPKDITRLTLLYAKRMLMQDKIGGSIVIGTNEFRPEMFNADLREIERIEMAYRQLPMGNT